MYYEQKGKFEKEFLNINSLTRDRCRTHMQWNSGLNAGFSSNPEVKPWLKVSDNYKNLMLLKKEKILVLC